MPRLNVVFDTNVYRKLSKSQFAHLLALERRQSVIAFASFSVASEMLSHLVSESDPNYRPSLAGLRRLTEHCTRYDGSRSIIHFVADHDEHVAMLLLGMDIPGAENRAEFAGQLIGTIAETDSPKALRNHQPYLQQVSRYAISAEQQFADNIFRTVVARLVPGATSWGALAAEKKLRAQFIKGLESDDAVRLMAAAMVARIERQLEVTLEQESREDAIDRTIRLFPIPIRFFNSILRRVAMDGYDLGNPRNRNSLWDYQIAFSTGPEATMEGIPLWLVTDDQRILEAARDCGCASIVSDMKAYLERLAAGEIP
jgi:hypothetical protein